ncbi:MAG: DUF4493 domain-containing protein [Bacteroidales bacterium]|nr:DUF4493 domain-containing protein [Bacteroidales bacterium]
MKKKNYLWILATLTIGVFAISCSSDHNDLQINEGQGTVMLSMATNASFGAESKILNEAAYKNTANYTVQIFNNQTQTKEYEFVYSDLENQGAITLENGAYTLKAFFGNEYVASQTDFLVTGSTSFTVNGDEKPTQEVSVSCEPTCGKFVVNFNSNMKNYFSDYYVTYSTKALKAETSTTAIWSKDNTAPWYLKLDKNEEVTATIHIIRASDGKSTEIVKTYVLSPNQGWNLNINPVYDPVVGSLGITITINEETNDIPLDVVIPSEWI